MLAPDSGIPTDNPEITVVPPESVTTPLSIVPVATGAEAFIGVVKVNTPPEAVPQGEANVKETIAVDPAFNRRIPELPIVVITPPRRAVMAAGL